MSTIMIKSDLNSTANEMRNYEDSISKCITYFEKLTEQIPTYWTGEDADSFLKKANEVIPELKKYAIAYETFADYLSKIYNIYSIYEQSYNKNIDCS